MTKQITLYEGVDNIIDGVLTNDDGSLVELDSSYVMDFAVMPLNSNTVSIYKCSDDDEQINYYDATNGRYRIIVPTKDVKGKNGIYPYILSVKLNGVIFLVEQGVVLIKNRTRAV